MTATYAIAKIIWYFSDAWCNSFGNLRFSLRSDGGVWHTATYLRRIGAGVTLPVKLFNRKTIYTPTSLSGPPRARHPAGAEVLSLVVVLDFRSSCRLSSIPLTAESSELVILIHTKLILTCTCYPDVLLLSSRGSLWIFKVCVDVVVIDVLLGIFGKVVFGTTEFKGRNIKKEKLGKVLYWFLSFCSKQWNA